MKKIDPRGFTGEEIDELARVFDELNIVLPRHRQAKATIQALMAEATRISASNAERLARPEGLQGKLDELYALPIIGPSGATKSKTLQRFVDEIQAAHPVPDEIPVLMVTLPSSVRSSRALQAEILAKFGDTSKSKILTTRGYRENEVNIGLMNIARERGTRVIVIDEAHNVLTYDAGGTAKIMAVALRSMVNAGVASIVLAGTEAIYPLINDKELKSRCKDSIYFDAASNDDADELNDFIAFAQEVVAKVFKAGVLDGQEPELFDTPDDAATIYDMTEGVHGQVVRLLKRAYERSLSLGYKRLDWKDINKSFQNHNRDNPRKIFNPLVKGPKKTTLAAVERIFGDEKAAD